MPRNDAIITLGVLSKKSEIYERGRTAREWLRSAERAARRALNDSLL